MLLEGVHSILYGVLEGDVSEASIEFNRNTGKFRLIQLSSNDVVLVVDVFEESTQAEVFGGNDPLGFAQIAQFQSPFNAARTVTLTRTTTGERFRVTFTPGPQGSGLSNVSITREP